MFKRLYETHINVRNLERSMSFYEYVGLERGAVDEARRVAFYFIGGWNDSMLGLWEKHPKRITSSKSSPNCPAIHAPIWG